MYLGFFFFLVLISFFFWLPPIYCAADTNNVHFISHSFLTCMQGSRKRATRVHVSHHNYFSMQSNRKRATRVHVSHHELFSAICATIQIFL